MVYFYHLFLNTDDEILKLYTSLCQKAKCTLFVWSTVARDRRLLSWRHDDTRCARSKVGITCSKSHGRVL